MPDEKTQDLKTEMAKAEEKDLTAEQLARCIPVAREMQKAVVSAELPIGDLKPEEVKAAYDVAVEAALKSMLDGGLMVQDIEVAIALTRQPFEILSKRLDHAIKLTMSQATEKKWSKPPEQVTMAELDAFLKS